MRPVRSITQDLPRRWRVMGPSRCGVCRRRSFTSGNSVCVFVNPDIYYNYCVTLYVRYMEVVSDGDSKTLYRLNELKLYGDNLEIVKHECVGHVQK